MNTLKVIFILSILSLYGCNGTTSGIIQGEKLDSLLLIPHIIEGSKFTHRADLGSRTLVSLFCIPCAFAVNTKVASQTTDLDNKCINAINNVLYLKGNDKTTSKVSIDVNYQVLTGVLKKVALQVDWYVDSEVKTKKIHVRTIVVSENAFDMFPTTSDEKYKDIFVDLAEKSAYDFFLILMGEKPKYSVDSVEFFG